MATVEHNYNWNCTRGEATDEQEELPEELREELEVVEFEGHKIEYTTYDGDLYGAVDSVEFVALFPVARHGEVANDENEFSVEGLSVDAEALLRRWYASTGDAALD